MNHQCIFRIFLHGTVQDNIDLEAVAELAELAEEQQATENSAPWQRESTWGTRKKMENNWGECGKTLEIGERCEKTRRFGENIGNILEN
jgi:hypothetical protein